MYSLFIVPIISFIVYLWPLPNYACYIIFRILVSLQSLYYLYEFMKKPQFYFKLLSAFFLAIFITFFPIFGVSMYRNDWKFLDLIVVISFTISNIYIIYKEHKVQSVNTSKSIPWLSIFLKDLKNVYSPWEMEFKPFKIAINKFIAGYRTAEINSLKDAYILFEIVLVNMILADHDVVTKGYPSPVAFELCRLHAKLVSAMCDKNFYNKDEAENALTVLKNKIFVDV